MATILVIDDEPQFRDFARRVLEADGHAVRAEETGDRGVRAYRDEPADVVVCDLFMDGQGGLQTIRELRRDFPGVRILAVSGGGRTVPGDYLPAARALGAAAVLAKPFSPEEFRDAVGRLLAAG
jgi:CheY-like chemotaxis protein